VKHPVRWLREEITAYFQQISQFNRNIWLLEIASILCGVANGIFTVDFNLYILNVGIKADGLGQILSAGPFAQAVSAIPIGFLGELLGYKNAFLGIFLIAGGAQLLQVVTPNLNLISLAAFAGGLALSGNFVVRLPFLSANVKGSERSHVFTLDSILSAISYAASALLAGHLPTWIGYFTSNTVLQYRYALLISGVFMLLAAVPIFMVKDIPVARNTKISLAPYLWGIDRLTVKLATVEFFVGMTMGLISPFMNLYFIYKLGVTREFYGSVEALAFIPAMMVLGLGPVLVRRFGLMKTILGSRFLVPICALLMAMALSPGVGTASYLGYKSFINMSQSIWFAFAMAAASKKAKVAISAWLGVTFDVAMGLSALVTGNLLAQSNYTLPFILAAAASLCSFGLTYFFVGGKREPVLETPAVESLAE
jgi:MFS family permease